MTPTPESIVVSLEWAKKLKDAGWPQDASIFWWFEHWQMGINENGEQVIEPKLLETVLLYNNGGSTARSLAAPTIGEIIKQIPVDQRKSMSYELMHDPNEWAELWISLNAQ